MHKLKKTYKYSGLGAQLAAKIAAIAVLPTNSAITANPQTYLRNTIVHIGQVQVHIIKEAKTRSGISDCAKHAIWYCLLRVWPLYVCGELTPKARYTAENTRRGVPDSTFSRRHEHNK